MQNALFETNLVTVTQLSETFSAEIYQTLPQDWWVVVTDVIGSTKAIEAGRYRDINAIGGSTIAAVLNAVKPQKIPYVFGGDGATFCIPPEVIEPVKQALRGCQILSEQTLQLGLRVGLVPVSHLTQPVTVCKYRVTASLTQYFFMGGGLEQADGLIKAQDSYNLPSNTPEKVDFSGFECRWSEVPSTRGLTLSLLVKSRLATQAESYSLYQTLNEKVFELLGDVHIHHPLKPESLNLSMNADKLGVEVATKTVNQSAWRVWRMRQVIRLQNVIGKVWMRFKIKNQFGDWGQYKADMVTNSDYLKLDDTYRAVLSGSQAQVDALVVWLEQACQQGQLFYGIHTTHAALITCLIAKTGLEHVHFVDSSEGGYAMAAKQLKQQIRHASEQAELAH
ncbi:MAG: DUF3095 domain-containing protein [Thiotrichales bacterium]|nr:DUF3095 domain-containing protein [Thiotrichales bacterium]